VYLALEAFRREEAELVPYLAAAHIPLLVGLALAVRELRRPLRDPAAERPEGLAGLFLFDKVRVIEQGMCLPPGCFRGWERFESFEFLGTERENWFRIRLHVRDGTLFPQDRSRRGYGKRLRAMSGILLPPAMSMASTVATLVVFLWGMSRLGWRHDVSSAFLAAVAHLLVALPTAFAVRSIRVDQDRRTHRLSSIDLLFDVREASATEVLCRLERYLPLHKD
jgi:hypothetical protein